ncbi:hypothetical protein OG429_01840 [Streptomyces sp. NBC_00190]|uniref:hypothetical protein n=1 Tax=unclassified Streptomyces TaxID=2593676 RepID=UPI002E2CDBB8|nr:hypothetical protein [Streptomyces sp. NBC_00190]WSZ45310.1 hypothetical protein OG239_04830 [Streptomyces sp. NBC_00868]
MSISCWEWDTGDGNDNSFRETMNRLNSNQFFSHIRTAIGAASPTLIGLMMDLTSMAITGLLGRSTSPASPSDRHRRIHL